MSFKLAVKLFDYGKHVQMGVLKILQGPIKRFFFFLDFVEVYVLLV